MFPRLASLLALVVAFALAFVLVRHGSGQNGAAAPTWAVSVKNGIKSIRDIPYVPEGHWRQRLDIFLPEKSTGTRPLLLWIHGGAWEGGDKNGLQSRALLDAGFAVASLEYRFSQDAIFPAQIEDCKAAIRWLRAHAAEYEFDPAHVGVWGASAGGHLAALLGTTGQMRDFDVGENLDQSSAVQCVVDWFGPTDFLHWGTNTPAMNKPDSAVTRLLGVNTPDKLEAARRASPITFVSKESAPFLMLHGDADPLVPLQQSITMDEALKKAGVFSEVITLPGSKHGGPAFTAPEQLKAMGDFVAKYLKPASGHE